MFRKIISNLAFSPALVGQLRSYTHYLRKEELARRFALIFMVMAIIIQSFVLFSPPEAANASSPGDLIRGGIHTTNDLLTYYDNDSYDVKPFFSSLGISRNELQQTVTKKIALSGWYEWTLNSLYRYGRESHAYTYQKTDGSNTTAYYRLITDRDTSSPNLVGYSRSLGQFAVNQASGNLFTINLPVANKSTTSMCSRSDTNCSDDLIYSISAQNTIHNDAIFTTKLSSNSRVGYTVTARNPSQKKLVTTISLPLRDILEYAVLIDDGGGALDEYNHTLSWAFDLPAGHTETRTFAVQLMDPIPSTNVSASDPDSYDCVMTVAFGNTLRLPVNCPPQKTIIEQTIASLPTSGIKENIIFAAVSFGILLYFYLRSVQLRNEVRIIRRDIHNGTL